MPLRFILQQYNDPKHTSCPVQQCLGSVVVGTTIRLQPHRKLVGRG